MCLRDGGRAWCREVQVREVLSIVEALTIGASSIENRDQSTPLRLSNVVLHFIVQTYYTLGSLTSSMRIACLADLHVLYSLAVRQ